jgi:hypothetical protein
MTIPEPTGRRTTASHSFMPRTTLGYEGTPRPPLRRCGALYWPLCLAVRKLVADVGCGPALDAPEFARMGPRVVALDLSAGVSGRYGDPASRVCLMACRPASIISATGWARSSGRTSIAHTKRHCPPVAGKIWAAAL